MIYFCLFFYWRYDSGFYFDCIKSFDWSIDSNTQYLSRVNKQTKRQIWQNREQKKLKNLVWLTGTYQDSIAIFHLILTIHFMCEFFQANSDSFVVKTLDRKTLWEMQTPQVCNDICSYFIISHRIHNFPGFFAKVVCL